jgi:hypothetical protein
VGRDPFLAGIASGLSTRFALTGGDHFMSGVHSSAGGAGGSPFPRFFASLSACFLAASQASKSP